MIDNFFYALLQLTFSVQTIAIDSYFMPHCDSNFFYALLVFATFKSTVAMESYCIYIVNDIENTITNNIYICYKLTYRPTMRL